MYDVLVNARPLAEVRRQVADNLWVCGSDINLAAAEVELIGVVGREVILRDLLLQDDGTFDFVFMDCAPSLGVLTLNALAAATEVFIPLQPHFLALHGLSKLLETTALITRRLNRRLTWNPDTETFPGDAEANALVDRPRRKGYELPSA